MCRMMQLVSEAAAAAAAAAVAQPTCSFVLEMMKGEKKLALPVKCILLLILLASATAVSFFLSFALLFFPSPASACAIQPSILLVAT